MVYLHSSNISNNLVRHWANEISDNFKNSDEYLIPTYKIRQIETDIIYDEGIDILPCRYTYEATDKIIINQEYTE